MSNHCLATRHRCIAPDLLGLGDTETPPNADWTLPALVAAILGLLDPLGLARVSVVGHDHGGAIAQMLAADHADRVDRLILSNVEAYDNWPSADERPLVRLTQLPIIGDLVMRAYGTRRVHRLLLSAGKAVKDRSAGHLLMEEQPDEVTNQILAFLGGSKHQSNA